MHMIVRHKTAPPAHYNKNLSNEENFVKHYLLATEHQNVDPWIMGDEFVGDAISFERNTNSDSLADIKMKIKPYACLLQNPQTTVVSGRITQDDEFPEILWFQLTQRASGQFKNNRLAFIDITDQVATKYTSKCLIVNSLSGVDFVPYNKNLFTTNNFYRLMGACACPYNFGPTKAILIPHRILPHLQSFFK